jgi:hypothetical protein
MVVSSFMGDGGTTSLGARSSLLGASQGATSTLFRDSPYIRALNQLLVQERRAAQTYLRVRTRRPSPRRLESFSENHRRSAREVVRLITMHSGLPWDYVISPIEPELVLIRICAVMPPAVGQKATVETLDLVERRIVRQYAKVLKLAPESDRPILLELQKKAAKHRESLRNRT